MICCVTGHRPKGFPFAYGFSDEICKDTVISTSFEAYKARLQKEVERLIDEGYTHFISGMADGVDLDFADCVIQNRLSGKNIFLEAALPCPASSKTLNDGKQNRKSYILNHADLIYNVSGHYYSGCMQKRNQYMVDRADLVLAIWNGEEKGGTWNTIKYAQKVCRTVRYITLSDFL